MVQNTINTSASILARAWGADRQEMSLELATYLLAIKLDPADAKQADDLAEKARNGTLTASEEVEIEEYLRTGRVIESLKLRARKVVNSAR